MAGTERPLVAELKAQIGSLGADLWEMVALRWELAGLELRAAAKQLKRLSITLLLLAVMVVSALPILAVAAAWALGKRELQGIAFVGWLLIFGLGLLIGGAAGGLLAWRRFRRRFVGMEQTLEELHEDAVWLRQWVARPADVERR